MRHLLATLILMALAGAAPAEESIQARIFRRGIDLLYEHTTTEAAREAGPRALEAIDLAVRVRPEDRELLEAAAEIHAAFAYAFLHETDPAAAIAGYRRAFEYACRALSPDGTFARAAEAGAEAFGRELARRDSRDLPALYWGAVAWGARLDLLRDALETPLELPAAVAMMERVRDLEPGYEFGGPDLFLAHFEAILGPGLGGSVERMKARFDDALAAGEGRFLLARVQYARDYAVATQDRGLFERTLREVVEACPEGLPERALFNRVARERAAGLLGRVEEFFP